MKIARISIKNFLGIVEAELSPKKINILAGKNRQGKSSFTKGIEAAFKGMTPAMIHYGAERAELVIDLEDLLVTRVQTHKTASVSVRDKRGWETKAPQAFLNGLIGGYAFNPMAFLLADDKKQQDHLLKAMDVAVTREQIQAAAGTEEAIPVLDSAPALQQYAAAHKWCYDARTILNRGLKQKQGALSQTLGKLPEGWKPPGDLEAKKSAMAGSLKSVSSRIITLQAEKKASEKAAETRERLTKQIAEDEEQAKKALAAAEAVKTTQEDIEAARTAVADLNAQLAVAEERLLELEDSIGLRDHQLLKVEEYEAKIAEARATLEGLPGAFDDDLFFSLEEELKGHREAWQGIEEAEKHLHTWNEADQYRADVVAAEAEAEKLDNLVVLFGKTLPAKALAEAKLPVEGLAVSEAGITVGGIPLGQKSTSEQMAVTLSIARALAGELPVICIDGYERLDEDSQAEFLRQGENDGFYYFVTRVGTPREGEVEVKEGKVVA